MLTQQVHNNVAVGNGALTANTTASHNTAVGYLSLCANTTGNKNTVILIGRLALTATHNRLSKHSRRFRCT
jgi:V8-like Glu-specific endopeptidase